MANWTISSLNRSNLIYIACMLVEYALFLTQLCLQFPSKATVTHIGHMPWQNGESCIPHVVSWLVCVQNGVWRYSILNPFLPRYAITAQFNFKQPPFSQFSKWGLQTSSSRFSIEFYARTMRQNCRGSIPDVLNSTCWVNVWLTGPYLV